MQTTLKLCLVFLVAFIGTACATLGSDARVAETWAQQACRVVQALPLASASTLPPGAAVHLTATSASGVTVVSSEGPPAVASATASAAASAGPP